MRRLPELPFQGSQKRSLEGMPAQANRTARQGEKLVGQTSRQPEPSKERKAYPASATFEAQMTRSKGD